MAQHKNTFSFAAIGDSSMSSDGGSGKKDDSGITIENREASDTETTAPNPNPNQASKTTNKPTGTSKNSARNKKCRENAKKRKEAEKFAAGSEHGNGKEVEYNGKLPGSHIINTVENFGANSAGIKTTSAEGQTESGISEDHDAGDDDGDDGDDVATIADDAETIRAKKAARNKRKRDNARKNKEKEAALPQSPTELFTITTSPTNKNLGYTLITNRTFKRGFLLFRESPLLPEAGGEGFIRTQASFALTSPEKQARFLALDHGLCTCGQEPCVESTLKRVFDCNNFRSPVVAAGGIEGNGDRSTNARTEGCGNAEEEAKVYGRLYELASRINHSCVPNATFIIVDGEIRIFALCKMKPGVEVTLDYTQGILNETPTQKTASVSGTTSKSKSNFESKPKPKSQTQTLAQRQRALKQFLGFDCLCSSCSALPITTTTTLPPPPHPPLTTFPIPLNSTPLNLPTSKEIQLTKRIDRFVRYLLTQLPFLRDRVEADIDVRSKGKKLSLITVAEVTAEAWGRLLRREDKFGISEEAMTCFLGECKAVFEGYVQRNPGVKVGEALDVFFEVLEAGIDL